MKMRLCSGSGRVVMAALLLVGTNSISLAQTPANMVGAIWTGCHIGGNVGWIGDDSTIDTAPTGGFVTLLPAPVDRAVNSHSYRFTNSSVTAGGQIGCDRQWGSIVFGVQADVSWTGLDRSVSTFYGPIVAPVSGGTWTAHTETLSHRLRWFSTLRGRLGYAFDRWLAFATGGLAIARIGSDFDYVNVLSPGTPNIGTSSTTRTGWTAGGGLEYAFDRKWSAKVEYLYLDFGSYSYDAIQSVNPTNTFTADVRSREHIVRVGLSFRWGR